MHKQRVNKTIIDAIIAHEEVDLMEIICANCGWSLLKYNETMHVGFSSGKRYRITRTE